MSNNVKSSSKVQRGINELDALLNENDPGFVFHTRKIPTPPNYSAEEIKNIRKQIPATQRVFAQIIAASPRTVEAWESGKSHPTGPTRRLIQIIAQNPKEARKFI
ncbi:helix-turn-helix domain-containing protein [Lacticaseibacillus chiayiensis]|uniref:helix-turn-helix domain-containing protein n=1 Tax=Lacticaseibacillus chiayiensis TaxID=2100821 RepID=UPI003C73EF48